MIIVRPSMKPRQLTSPPPPHRRDATCNLPACPHCEGDHFQELQIGYFGSIGLVEAKRRLTDTLFLQA